MTTLTEAMVGENDAGNIRLESRGNGVMIRVHIAELNSLTVAVAYSARCYIIFRSEMIMLDNV